MCELFVDKLKIFMHCAAATDLIELGFIDTVCWFDCKLDNTIQNFLAIKLIFINNCSLIAFDDKYNNTLYCTIVTHLT